VNDNAAPPATSQVSAVSAPLSPRQQKVLNVLRTFPEGARSIDVAHVLGMHVNTVREHLDELVTKGTVRVTRARARGRGRPSLIYAMRTPDSGALARDYIALIEILSTSVPSTEAAHAVGKLWARAMKMDRGTSLVSLLRTMGFDPTEEVGGRIDIHSCPFVTGGEAPSRSVCDIHAGLISDLHGNENRHPELIPFAEPGICSIRNT
jgi:Predicted transcriptional regulator